MGELENYRHYIGRLVKYSENKTLDEHMKKNVQNVLEDMLDANEFNDIFLRVTTVEIDPTDHAKKIMEKVKKKKEKEGEKEKVGDKDKWVELCEELVRLLREARHVKFHRRRPEMLSRIASNMKPSLKFNPLNNKQPVWAIATSSDGTLIATAGASGEIKIWVRSKFHTNEDGDDKYDSDDEHDSVYADDMDIIDWTPNKCKDIDMWQCVSSKRLLESHRKWEDHQVLADSYAVFSKGHRTSVWSMAFDDEASRDGLDGEIMRMTGRLISGSSDGSIHIWDLETSKSVFGPLRRHRGTVWCVDVSRSNVRSVL